MKRSILIAHSDSESAGRLRSVAEQSGLQAFCASSPQMAVDLLRLQQYGLVVLDARLLAEDHAICRKLRGVYPGRRLPIVLLIPEDDEPLEDPSHLRDFDDYFFFPCSDRELRTRLQLRQAEEKSPTGNPLAGVDFKFLSNLSSLAVSGLTATEILQQVVNSISAVMEVERCSITMVREEVDPAYVMASSDDCAVNGLRIDLQRYPEIQEVISSARAVLIDDVRHHPLLDSVRPYLEKLDFSSLLVLPMVDRQRVAGVLVLRAARRFRGFSEQEVSFCQLVANMATSALRLAEIRHPDPDAQQQERGERPALGIKERTSLLNMAAHDLRVLVSVIDGYCLLLSEADNGNLLPEQNEIVSGLMAGNRRLVDLANDLLDFSQLEAGRFELNLEQRDICQILGSVFGELLPLLQRRQISLQADCLDRTMPVVCDEHGIRRVFYNILNNALKYTPDGGTIRLELAEAKGETRITVEDNGPGIDPQHISGLFDEFSSVSLADPRAGNGLGLSICKKIVEAHQGRIWAESCPGQGSRFTFCLPQ